ncbi:MAG: hypothetical protein FWD67_09930, partial [Betaproteobacteria bacterium]|nr:hypothetical protein [Betaproteobacteria bacterium]
MRGTELSQFSLFSYRTLEERIPDAHPLRKLRVLVDGILADLRAELETLVAVGTAVARCPPHRSVRAELPHTALTSGDDARIAPPGMGA